MDIKPLNSYIQNLTKPLVIAGPCSAESEEQVMAVAREVKNIEQVKIFRAGIWKPRTRPGTFEGVGSLGLPWLKKVKHETGLLVSTEVANAWHVEEALKHDIDILWIGARTTASPFAIQEIADAVKGTNIPVFVKNPINVDLALWIGALERLYNCGITKMAAIHRGFSAPDKTKYRNMPLWRIPIELKRRHPNIPIICDPSHIAGNRSLVPVVCQKAMDVNQDGLMIETHCDPNNAMSDAAQQITPSSLRELLGGLSLKTERSDDKDFEHHLEELRAKIDRIDHDLLEVLQQRMEVVEKIGEAKAECNITALQLSRMDELLIDRMRQGESLGLSPEYIKELYNVIHEESVRKQTRIMSNKKK
ncbi:MAG: bifunctional 3-deoxy-7-phosphoheptulonate synthase/chorismate mutase type II [Halobacteriovoraceae bacterium]|nr:bifunctional 3-deoxy-7-phosphoheptulonate synthase/chorismate mutase type II [Halobacteriovoraceae bacterium]